MRWRIICLASSTGSRRRAWHSSPTSYLNHDHAQPAAEYVFPADLPALRRRSASLISVQIAAFRGCIIAVSSIAGPLGLDRKAKIVAALFCGHLSERHPAGLPEPRTICWLSLWLAIVVYLVIRWCKGRRSKMPLFCSLAAGLALGTKNAYLFLPPLVAARCSRPVLAIGSAERTWITAAVEFVQQSS